MSTSAAISVRSAPASAFFRTMALVLSVWLSVIVALGLKGAFRATPGTPPVAMLLAVLTPPVLLLVLLRVPAVRSQILAIDPVWLAAVHGLRVLGVGFLFVHAFGHLPGLFAHPAGWGDLAVGLLAPFAATRLARNPDFIRSSWLWRFHALGMLDFVGAIGSGLFAARLSWMDTTAIPTAALGQLPLLLIPAFAVPLWICLHLTAFAQIREARCAVARHRAAHATHPTEGRVDPESRTGAMSSSAILRHKQNRKAHPLGGLDRLGPLTSVHPVGATTAPAEFYERNRGVWALIRHALAGYRRRRSERRVAALIERHGGKVTDALEREIERKALERW